MLKASSYEEANQIGERVSGRKISIQCWSIIPQLIEMDDALTPGLQDKVFEVHPEVCFCAMNSGPVVKKKKEEAGRELRRSLLKQHLLIDPAIFYTALPSGALKDDLLDALAALWTAERAVRGIARRIPEEKQRDERGLSAPNKNRTLAC
jgi:predicted RNase H-like nuclease